MATTRKVREHWTEVKRVVEDSGGNAVVKQTTCCCAAPGVTPAQCAIVSGNKSRCRCDCHRRKV